ncbi:MAG: hypothetical protein HYX48_00740 [Chlamydiales bacterium]|nr:hypothetical protein [Chlamydiales bacterium]
MTSSITSFVETFFWAQQDLILPAVLAIPAAIEATLFLGSCYQNREGIAERLKEAKVHLFDIYENKPADVAKLAAVAVLLSGSIIAPFCLLSPTLALPSALLAIVGIGLLWEGAERVPGLIQDLSAWTFETFTPKNEESERDYYLRIGGGVCKVLLVSALALSTGLIAFKAGGIIKAVIGMWATRPWSIPSLLPMQTPAVVLMEYALVGLCHLLLAVRAYQKDEKMMALFHGVNALLSFIFPAVYWRDEGSNLRLHHSFTGLLMQLMPFRCTKMLGALISFDSLLYFISSNRGHWTYGRFSNFDFMNIVVGNISLILLFYVAAGFIELASKKIEKMVQFEPCRLKETSRSKSISALSS